MKVQPRYFEDYVMGESRTTMGRTITETDIVMHAAQTGDYFPHHMDVEFAKDTEFGQRIAHGTLVLSVGIGMTAADINPLAFSYGYDRIRFVKPVFIGDTIHVVATFTTRHDHPRRPSHGYLTERIDVVNQHGDVVLVCDHLYLAERREAPTTGEGFDG